MRRDTAAYLGASSAGEGSEKSRLFAPVRGSEIPARHAWLSENKHAANRGAAEERV